MTVQRYDPTLGMHVDEVREPDPSHLEFMRWLAERGRLEHQPFGPSCGIFAGALRHEGDKRRGAAWLPPWLG